MNNKVIYYQKKQVHDDDSHVDEIASLNKMPKKAMGFVATSTSCKCLQEISVGGHIVISTPNKNYASIQEK